jgi:adenylate cyclase
MRTLVSIGAPLSRYGGLTPAGAATLSRTLQLLMATPRTERRPRKLTLAQIARRVGEKEEVVTRWARAGLLGDPAEPGPPPRWDRDGIDQADLVAYLRRRGVAERSILKAHRDGQLSLLIIDETLVHSGTMTIRQLAEAAAIPQALAKRLWRALGLPPPEAGEKIFTRQDVVAMRLLGALRTVFSDEALVESAAVLGSSMARYASAEVEMFRRELTRPFAGTGASEVEIAWRLANLVDLIIPPGALAMETVHRWHLEVAMRSESVVRIEERAGALPGQVELTVAFADLVGYTAASDRLSALEIGEVAGAFLRCAEATLPDRGARIVKSIGDAVMFSARDPVSGAAAGIALITSAAQDPSLPPVRVGVAHGPVLRRYADYFGRTVNIASRLSTEGNPGRVLVLEPEPPPAVEEWAKAGLKVVRRRRLSLRGISHRVTALEVAGVR